MMSILAIIILRFVGPLLGFDTNADPIQSSAFLHLFRWVPKLRIELVANNKFMLKNWFLLFASKLAKNTFGKD
jgi:hypothetical protein